MFGESKLPVNENVGTVMVPIIRTGDLSSVVTVLCSTKSQMATGSEGRSLESGTDYISLLDKIITFDIGQSEAYCEVKVKPIGICSLFLKQFFSWMISLLSW